ncbi:MAG: lipoprotein [Methylohalobius sp.]|nr:lipoprotein [Methylohalobius sp.]
MAKSWSVIVLTLWVLVAAQLVGCGQKGPLYLPEPEKDQVEERR